MRSCTYNRVWIHTPSKQLVYILDYYWEIFQCHESNRPEEFHHFFNLIILHVCSDRAYAGCISILRCLGECILRMGVLSLSFAKANCLWGVFFPPSLVTNAIQVVAFFKDISRICNPSEYIVLRVYKGIAYAEAYFPKIERLYIRNKYVVLHAHTRRRIM